ncbi:hypothetical protein [Streptacidiphilus sp. EB129]|uniref:hypothetical protein n=1 Tax=Streptacidiphilus sp. EB129 TaxID=3156262 RepID=UPI0035129F05
MSDAVSPHGFSVTRRGYDPAQVERLLARLTRDRDEAWQRLSGLGDRMRALEQRLIDAAEAASAARAAEEAAPPTFAELGERAARIVDLATAEAEQLRVDAGQWIDALDARTRAEAQQLRADAEHAAVQLCDAADEAHRRELERARAQSEAERGAADRDARSLREQADAYAGDVRARAEQAERAASAWLTEQLRAADQEQAEAEARWTAWEAEVGAGAQRKQVEAERHRRAMQAKADEMDAEAATRAERIVEDARREAERIAEAAARDQAAHAERRDALQAHLDHIRTTLTTLTGAPAPAPTPTSAGTPAPDGSEAATDEIPAPGNDA